MFDREVMSLQFHCRRCGTLLDAAPEDGRSELWDCPRCRRAALATSRREAVEEDQIIDWLLAGSDD